MGYKTSITSPFCTFYEKTLWAGKERFNNKKYIKTEGRHPARNHRLTTELLTQMDNTQ